jgi:cation diffusion facilitator family transporter
MGLPLPPRHSNAALQSAAQGESVRTIVVAFLANVVIAVAKLVAGLVSGSAALLAEAAHSFADSLNEILLGASLFRARRPADATHPLGFGRERFLWAFLAAIASFLIGGGLSITLAIRNLRAPSVAGDGGAGLAWVVLAIAFLADGTSWLQGMRQARRKARERGQGVWRYLKRTSDPTLRVVVVEDSAALIGVGLAAAGQLLSQLTGSDTPDAVAALLIGVLLALTAVGLARILGDFLVGRSLPEDQLQQLQAIVASSPAIEEVLSLRAVYTAPEEAIVAAKIHPNERLSSDELARAMDALDIAIRAALPEVADVYFDVTTFRLDTLPGGDGETARRRDGKMASRES